VLRVEALEIEEQRDWGLRSPRSGRWVAALGEHRLIRQADVLCPVSPSLQRSLEALGVPSERIVTTPNGIDLAMFRPGAGVREEELTAHGLRGRFLIGWVGGFRPYHGLEQLESLVSGLEQVLPDATVCLVGTGPLRPKLEEVARRHPQSLRLLPPVPQHEVPRWLNQFDVCIQLAHPDAADHYSPLKVLEYLACGRPVVAPDIASAEMLTDGEDALIYPAGDVTRLLAAIRHLHDQPGRSSAIATRGREVAEAHGSWTAVARRILEARSRSG
jgi:glycosyltransferase involved in cell wall biosynthesis